jgi:hypothetical protein
MLKEKIVLGTPHIDGEFNFLQEKVEVSLRDSLFYMPLSISKAGLL